MAAVQRGGQQGSILRRLALVWLASALTLSGCSTIEHKPRGFVTEGPPATAVTPAEARKIAIFFDGTANDEGSDTNIKRLHSLITLQDRGDIASLYLLGVGTNDDALGAITGSGINARVRIAYEFILNHYRPAESGRPADEIYIFGFSRGAYAARILTTMLHFAGIVEETIKKGKSRRYTSTEISDLVHIATFPPFLGDDVDRTAGRRGRLDSALPEALRAGEHPRKSVQVKVLGLWDTVEALGPPIIPWRHLEVALSLGAPAVNIDIANGRYGEGLCNVEWAYHAVSIDDNRATIFTPLLLSRKHLFEACDGSNPMLDGQGKIKPGHLQEVWFSGAHSDVGGGYLDSTLSGVSLNWMISRLSEIEGKTGLLPKRFGADKAPPSTKPDSTNKAPMRYVREDVFGSSHDPAAGVWAILYPRVNRDLVAYSTSKGTREEFRRTICVDESVFRRRSVVAPKDHEYHQLELTQSGDVQLPPHGKERQWQWQWQWLGEGGAKTEQSNKTILVQQYPCDFMPKEKK